MEFSGLGAALSTRRRTDAEDGPHHKTARRLAALFEQLIPSTPKLITAYGLRSTEIIQTPGVNPKGSPKHGPFETYVGADGTAMWAAATSGVPALGVYFLACLLARAWDAKEAISIWVELVNKRRDEIEDGWKMNHAVSESSRMSVYQDISREDLARWDASARAWLRSADEVKAKEQTQLMLIIKNIQVPFNGGESTYSKVIEAWQQAMSALEQLLCGRPQEISNRSILLAFSAWHLYPNLVVLGSETKNVQFSDHIMDPRGAATIAKEPRFKKAAQGSSWSLALSHLRYYGDPVTVESHTDFSRVTIQQLHIIALGSLFNAWDIEQRDVLSVAQWFASLWDFLCQGASERLVLDRLAWLRYLAQATKELLRQGVGRESEAFQLFYYGQRRAKQFLGVSKTPLEPFFGLANEPILAGLSEKDEEERVVAYLRKVTKMNRLRSSEAYIVSDWKICADNCTAMACELMTAIPHTCASRKRDIDGNVLSEAAHARWIYIDNMHGSGIHHDHGVLDSILRRRLEQLAARGERGLMISNVPYQVHHNEWTWDDPPFLLDYPMHSQLDLQGSNETDSYRCPSISNSSDSCRCFDCDHRPIDRAEQPCKFLQLLTIGRYKLFVNEASKYKHSRYKKAIRIRKEDYLHPMLSIERLCELSIEADVVSSYLQFLLCPAMDQKSSQSTWEGGDNGQGDSEERDEGSDSSDSEAVTDQSGLHAADQRRRSSTWRASAEDFNYRRELASIFRCSPKRSWAFHALVSATQVYQQLEGATVSLKIVKAPLSEASWLTRRMIKAGDMDQSKAQWFPSSVPQPFRRSNMLGCIAHFESGTLSLLPKNFEKTLAIASGNSLFVIGALVSDPFDMNAEDVVKRIIGNIGRTGICMLESPIEPRIRPFGDQYNIVTHAAYDGKREDNFKGTSLHLSFTDWILPLEVKGAESRTIDQEAYVVESVISVLDSGKWVADLDILSTDFQKLHRLKMPAQCPGHPNGLSDYDHTSLDTWEEFLDGPTNVGFFRAHGNWAARLAAVSILSQQQQGHSIGLLGPGKICLECSNTMYDHGWGLRKHESRLPAFCID